MKSSLLSYRFPYAYENVIIQQDLFSRKPGFGLSICHLRKQITKAVRLWSGSVSSPSKHIIYVAPASYSSQSRSLCGRAMHDECIRVKYNEGQDLEISEGRCAVKSQKVTRSELFQA
jgi:hypothetical protein